MVAHLLPKSGISETTKISAGFGERSSPDDYPGKDTLVQLSQHFDPRQIWRTIALRKVIKGTSEESSLPTSSWRDAVKWVVDQPETVERILFRADQDLDQAGIHHLILFAFFFKPAHGGFILKRILCYGSLYFNYQLFR